MKDKTEKKKRIYLFNFIMALGILLTIVLLCLKLFNAARSIFTVYG